MSRTWTVFVAMAATALSADVSAQERIGRIVSVDGNGTITRGDIEFRATPSAPLLVMDGVGTLKDSGLNFRLADGSSHSLGEKTRLDIKEFTYDPDNPANNKLALSLHSGELISKGEGVVWEIETPNGVVRANPHLKIQIVSGPDGDVVIVTNYGAPATVTTRLGTFPIPGGTVVAIDPSGNVRFVDDAEAAPSQGPPAQDPDRVEPPGPPDTPPPGPTGEPGPPSPRPTPPVPTPTPPVPTPTPSAGPPTPSPSPSPTASPTPTLPPPSPTPTPTPVSPM